MTERALHNGKVGTGLDQAASEAVAQRVRCCRLKALCEVEHLADPLQRCDRLGINSKPPRCLMRALLHHPLHQTLVDTGLHRAACFRRMKAGEEWLSLDLAAK